MGIATEVRSEHIHDRIVAGIGAVMMAGPAGSGSSGSSGREDGRVGIGEGCAAFVSRLGHKHVGKKQLRAGRLARRSGASGAGLRGASDEY